MEIYTKENLKSLFNKNDSSKENLIKKLNKIDEIYSLNNEYINNIQNLTFENYLAYVGKPLKNYPKAPCEKPIHGDNFPPLIDTRIKPLKEHPNFFKFYEDRLLTFGTGIVFMLIIWIRTNEMSVRTLLLLILIWFFVFETSTYLIGLSKSNKKYEKDMAEFNLGYSSVVADYNSKKADYQKKLEKYKDYEKQKLEIEAYNNELLSSDNYKNDYKQFLEEQKELYDLYQDPEVINLMKSFLHKEYWKYCKDIAKIIETGRADSLKEALNILINDLNSKKLLEEQQRKNDILLEDLKKQREIQEQAHADQLKFYNAQLEIDKFRINEAVRHNSAMEMSNENKAKAVALCANCPIVNQCTHVGKKTKSCRNVKRYN